MTDNYNVNVVVTVPTHMSIAVPQPILPRRGVEGIVKYGTAMLVRVSHDHATLIKQEAARLGIPVNSFIRWCAVAMARELKRHRGEECNVDL